MIGGNHRLWALQHICAKEYNGDWNRMFTAVTRYVQGRPVLPYAGWARTYCQVAVGLDDMEIALVRIFFLRVA